MDDKKIAFIICANDNDYYEECVTYIHNIHIPDGYTIDVISIVEAESMTMGYNAGMKSTDAKYKVYLHQDVFIINQNFIQDMLNIFLENMDIGLMGVIGGVDLPANGIVYDAWNCGRTQCCDTITCVSADYFEKEPYIYVEAIDGMLMITQYDLDWREDLLKEWDFYDISQSFEFRKAGYKVAIPYQEQPWCLHDCGHTSMEYYEKNRKIMLQEYGTFFIGSNVQEKVYNNIEMRILSKQCIDIVKEMIENKQIKEVEQFLEGYKENSVNSEMTILSHIAEIGKAERSYLGEVNIWNQSTGKGEGRSAWILFDYLKTKFLLRRIEYDIELPIIDFDKWLQEESRGYIKIGRIILNTICNKTKVFNILMIRYKKLQNNSAFQYLQTLEKAIHNLKHEKEKQIFCKKVSEKAEKYFINLEKDNNELFK